MIVFVKLILAHLLGDFVVQPDRWVARKEEKKWAAWELYVHALIHAGLTAILLWDALQWYIPLAVFVSHLVIDGVKLSLQTEKTKRIFFFIDQLLHVAFLFAIYAYVVADPVSFPLNNWTHEQLILATTFIIFLTSPSSILIRHTIAKWTPQLEMGNGQEVEDLSLQSAGKYIGILERLFVFGFVVSGNLEAVGFLIAAKSLLRFGDLKNGAERKLTEYVLIGTLLSFGIAMIAALAYLYLQSLI